MQKVFLGPTTDLQKWRTTLWLLHAIASLQELYEWLIRCSKVELRIGGVACSIPTDSNTQKSLMNLEDCTDHK